MKSDTWQLCMGLAMALQLGFAGRADAQGVEVSVNPAAQTVNTGDSVSIQIRVDTNGQAVCQGGVFLQFDSARLGFVGGANNTDIWNLTIFNVQPAETEPGIVSLNVGATSAVNANHVLVSTLNFAANAPGNAALTLLFNAGAEETLFFAANCTDPVVTNRTGGSVTIQAATATPTISTPAPSVTPTPPSFSRGDVNHDGTVDVLDVQALIDALFSPVPPLEADVNADDRVTVADVPALLALL